MTVIAMSEFRRRYFPVFMGVIFSAIASLSVSAGLGLVTFFRDIPVDVGSRYMTWCGWVFSILLTHFNFMVLRGRPSWLWGTVVILCACMVFSLATVKYRPDNLTYCAGVIFPLLGLYLLNTKRHRDMRALLVEMRQERELIRQAIKNENLSTEKSQACDLKRLIARVWARK